MKRDPSSIVIVSLEQMVEYLLREWASPSRSRETNRPIARITVNQALLNDAPSRSFEELGTSALDIRLNARTVSAERRA
jgi:hypothetical protein